MKTSELIKLLKKSGCMMIEEGSRHEKWYSPITGNTFTVPRHGAKEIRTGTCQAIKKQAGLK